MEIIPQPFSWFRYCRQSKQLLVMVVAVSLFLDYVLLTTIVSMMPQYLYDIEHPVQQTKHAKLSLNPRATLTKSTNNASQSHKDLVRENTVVGIMFAAKPLLQIISNPFVGPLTNKIGYNIPLMIGGLILFSTTIVFAFGKSYIVLFMARSLQGVGSSFIAVSGLGLVATSFPDENERGTAISMVFSGTCLGVLLGPPFGGFMYQFVGYSSPFLVISGLVLLNEVLMLLVLTPAIDKSNAEGPSLRSLIADPYILIAAGTIIIGNIGIAVLEPALPLWMMDTMGSKQWEQGAIFISSSVAYLIGAALIGRFGHLVGRWKIALSALVLQAMCLFAIPYAKNIYYLIIPNAGVGIAVGIVDNTMMPELGHLVDIRHAAVYGNVYAIGNFAISSSYVIGPALSAALVNKIGFKNTLYGIAILGLLVSPLTFLLKNPPSKEEKKPLLTDEDDFPTLMQENGTK